MSQQTQPTQAVFPTSLTYAAPNGPQADEVFNEQGKVREHWSYLLDSLKTLGGPAFEERRTKALRILRDDGATYNIHGDDYTPNRTWELDLVPALISSSEWGKIEAGLLERAELFNLLLRDIYGSRDLIRHGVIPPEALFSHQGFLRACQGIHLSGDHDLILHAVDLIRDPSGKMCVLTDRTQSPSGAGYALENRTVMSRVLPSLFRDSHVHRLAIFFQKLRAKLASLSLSQEQPRIVVLTPGAHNETYFEHAYLANYLGLHLVQSGDLVVRNGYVWMKSLDGLSRVDVILRRVDDLFCDPVELRSDSQLGVASLLEVVRAGRVVIANPLGSGILENPVFLRYLPAISKALIGRELRLPSVTTHWCGDDKDRQYVLEHLDSLVIKPTYRGSGQSSVITAELSKAQREELVANIMQHPLHYAAQPLMSASQLPTYVNGRLEARPSLLRSFAVASEGSYAIMPGGLTRVGVERNTFVISNQVGAQSKDTWVVASEPERVGIQDVDENATTVREADLISLPSRVVENLFWMGRYAERAESSLRILRTVFMMLNGETNISDVAKEALLRTVTEVTATQPGFLEAPQEMFDSPEEELLLIIKDPQRMGSVRSNLNAMLNCADESKELLSSDMLRVINDVRDALYDLDEALSGGLASAPEEALDPFVTALMALAGLTQESMVRGIGWRFMDMGRRLERGMQTTAMIQCLLVPEVTEPDQNMMIQGLLLSLEALISYRRRYRARMGVQSCLDLVMMDTTNPRSLLYQLEQLNRHVSALPRPNETRHELTPEERAALEAETLIKLTQLTEMSQRDGGKRQKLDQHLERVSQLLAGISGFISDKYFDHRESSQQLVQSVWENNS